MRPKFFSTITVLLLSSMLIPAIAQVPSAPIQTQPSGTPLTAVDPAVVPIGDAQGSLMKSKLLTSQKVLEGLVRKDFDKIAAGARDMKQISEAAEWPRARDSVYEHFGKVFRQQCAQLEKLATEGNNEGVTFMYLSMTNTCVNCHDYVRDSFRIARPNEGDVRLIPSQWPATELNNNRLNNNGPPKRSN